MIARYITERGELVLISPVPALTECVKALVVVGAGRGGEQLEERRECPAQPSV